jgi:pimeloyl-ACP methyl ester carboxylesterase
MDPIRRDILTTGAAAVTAAAPQAFARQPDPGGAFRFYEHGDVRIRYQDVGSGFPLLVVPGGGLNSRISNWATAVINARDAFKSDFRCIAMDQRNASGGESTGPIPIGARLRALGGGTGPSLSWRAKHATGLARWARHP